MAFPQGHQPLGLHPMLKAAQAICLPKLTVSKPASSRCRSCAASCSVQRGYGASK